jgi:5-methylcytosine-specific restriction endonuclease McrA
MFRRDVFGALMKFSDQGNRQSIYGWEIDHIVPVARGGSDRIENLQPLHWQNNVVKADR